MKALPIAVAVFAATALAGCATVTRGTKQKFEILSEPNGAAVTTTHGVSCVTPCQIKMKRKDAFTATFKKDGFETQSANVQSKFSGGGAAAGAGNILIGGFIGAGVDASNGSLNNLTPNPLKVVLVAVAAPVEAQPEAAPLPAAEAAPTAEAVPSSDPAPAEAPASVDTAGAGATPQL